METKTINYQGHEIKVSSKHQGTAYPWGEKYEKQHHRVTVRCGAHKMTFSYYCNDVTLGAYELRNALYCILGDAIAYKNVEDILDFANEFGYELHTQDDRKRLREVWNGCKDAWEKWEPFGIDPYGLSNWMKPLTSLWSLWNKPTE